MNWQDYFSHYKQKTIMVDKIKETAHIENQAELKALIEQLVQKEYITPIGKEKTYQCPQVYKKYKIKEETNLELIHEMDYLYHVSMNMDYYKRHIEDYKKDKLRIRQLSDYLKKGKQNESEAMSVNERSFEIFADEKYLASKEGETVRNRLKLPLGSFRVYRTPEPFFYYYNPDIQAENVLIIENKDTWYTMRQLLRERRQICGMSFCSVIYGEGRKIQKSFRDIDFDDYSPFNHQNNAFYYFGDIDSYGLDILVRLKEENMAYHILPFERAYQFLLDKKAMKRKKTGQDKVALDHEKIKSIFVELSEMEKEELLAICSDNYLLPQEILNNEILRKENPPCYRI